MEANRQTTYSVEQDSSDKAASRKVLANEVRIRLRRFTRTEPFSQEWSDTIEPLKSLASLAQQEFDRVTISRAQPLTESPSASSGGAPTPTSSAVTSGEGVVFGRTAEGTVWDRDEVVVRVLVEEGKINLLTRCLREFKDAAAGVQPPGGPAGLQLQARTYEQSLGVVVRIGLGVIECLQTIDVRGLMDHIATVLSRAVETPGTDPTIQEGDMLLQEALVLVYLDQLYAHVERLQSHVIGEKLVEHNMVGLLLRHFRRNLPVLDQATVASVLWFFARLFDSEFFRSKIVSFFPSKEDKESFARLMEGHAKAHIAACPTDKKGLRPLTDMILRWK